MREGRGGKWVRRLPDPLASTSYQGRTERGKPAGRAGVGLGFGFPEAHKYEFGRNFEPLGLRSLSRDSVCITRIFLKC